ncbi:type I methionyl aminopeptidase [Patescibacteria group bacterium]
MAIIEKEQDLKNLRLSGKILIQVLEKVVDAIRPGVKTNDLDQIAEHETKINGARASFKGYQPSFSFTPYPGSICISINSEVVHGIPSQRELYDGDIVSLDFGIEYKKMFTDCAITIPVGDVEEEHLKLIQTTYKALCAGVKQTKAGNWTGDIGNAVESVAKKNSFHVVRTLVGHGVGYSEHEDPQVPNYGKKKTGTKLDNNLTIAIEPMITMGSHDVELMKDNWTFVTDDDSYSAHFEQTVRATEKGAEIITPYSERIKKYARISD